MRVCACVSWSAPLDAMKSQNLQTYFKATILLSPCPSSYLVSITQAVARRVHGRVPGSRERPVAAHARRRLHWNCSTCAYLVSATWPAQPEGALILKVAEDQGSGLPELVPPPGRRQGCHTSSQEVVTVGLPSRLPRREVLAGPRAGVGPEAVQAGMRLRPGTAGHSSVCQLSVHHL